MLFVTNAVVSVDIHMNDTMKNYQYVAHALCKPHLMEYIPSGNNYRVYTLYSENHNDFDTKEYESQQYTIFTSRHTNLRPCGQCYAFPCLAVFQAIQKPNKHNISR